MPPAQVCNAGTARPGLFLDLTEEDFLAFLQSDGTFEKSVAKDITMKHTVYAIDEKMNPEAMGAYERVFAVGELANAEKIFTVSFCCGDF